VAVVGSLVSTSYRSGLAVTGMAPALARAARSSVAAADQVARGGRAKRDKVGRGRPSGVHHGHEQRARGR